MTAVLDEHHLDDDATKYPERFSVRITEADYELYDMLEELPAPKSVTTSHVVVALLRRFQDNPELQEQILQEAQEIAGQRKEAANERRKSAVSTSMRARAQRLRNRAET